MIGWYTNSLEQYLRRDLSTNKVDQSNRDQ